MRPANEGIDLGRREVNRVPAGAPTKQRNVAMMTRSIGRRAVLGTITTLSLATWIAQPRRARGADAPIRIGVLTDRKSVV